MAASILAAHMLGHIVLARCPVANAGQVALSSASRLLIEIEEDLLKARAVLTRQALKCIETQAGVLHHHCST